MICVVVRSVIRVCVCICEPCGVNAHIASERARVAQSSCLRFSAAHEAISTPTLPAIILAALLTPHALRLTCRVAADRGNGSGSSGGGSGGSGGGGCGGRDSIGVGVGVAPTPTPSCPAPAQSTHRATFLRAIGLERGRGRGCYRSRRVE